MESMNMYVLAILSCIVIIIVMFFSLSLDKIIIKPLIKNYSISDIHIKLEQLKSLTLMITNIAGVMSYGK